MRKVIFIIIGILAISSCNKEKSSNPSEMHSHLSGIDFAKSIHSDYITGKRTIVFESGKKVVKEIPIDSTSGLRVSSTSGAKGGTTTNTEDEEFIEWNEVPLEEVEPTLASQPLLNLFVGARLVRDRNTRQFIGHQGFYGYVSPPITYYIASNGEQATRTASVMSVTGTVAPLPGLPVFITYHCFVNVVYRYESGFTFTRQYERSGNRVQY